MSPFSIILRSPALRLSLLGLLGLGVMNASLAPYLSLIAIERIGLSESAFSLVLTVSALVAVASAVVMGIMGDQRGRRHAIAVVTALASLIGVALMVIAPSPWALILCHALLFPFGSSLFGQFFALSQLASPPAPAADAVMGILRAGLSAAFMLMLGFWALAFGAGVDVMWVYAPTMVAAAAVTGLCIWLWPRGPQVTWQDRPSGLNMRAAMAELARPLVASRLLFLGAINASAVLYFVLIGLVFDASATRDASDVALYVGLVAGVEVPCLVLVPRLAARVSRSTLMAIGAAAYTLHLLLMPIWVDTIWLWAGALIAGLGGTAFIGLTITYYHELLADRPGAASAMLALQKMVADVLGAAAFGLGMAFGSYQTVAIIGFVLTMAGAIGLYAADRTGWLVPVKPQTVR